MVEVLQRTLTCLQTTEEKQETCPKGLSLFSDLLYKNVIESKKQSLLTDFFKVDMYINTCTYI